MEFMQCCTLSATTAYTTASLTAHTTAERESKCESKPAAVPAVQDTPNIVHTSFSLSTDTPTCLAVTDARMLQ